MPPADKEMVQLLNHELISNEVDLLLGDAVAALEPYNPEDPEGAVKVRLRSGTVLNKVSSFSCISYLGQFTH